MDVWTKNDQGSSRDIRQTLGENSRLFGKFFFQYCFLLVAQTSALVTAKIFEFHRITVYKNFNEVRVSFTHNWMQKLINLIVVSVDKPFYELQLLPFPRCREKQSRKPVTR